MSWTKQIKVMLVDDHPIVRDALQALLEQSADFEVVGQAGDGVEAVKVAEDTRPDVIVMDVMMPERGGVEACRDIMELLPDTRVLMLTASSEEGAVIQAVAAGATGYLHKFSPKADLLTALRQVVEGRLRIPDETVKRVFSAIREGSGPGDRCGPGALNPRERDILALFASGKSYAQIAAIKGNSPLTIRNVVYRIQDRVGARTKQEVVVWAVRNGLLDT